MICRESFATCISSASQALVTAALIGLLGLAACEDTETSATNGILGNGITSSIVDSSITYEKFKVMCDDKNGKMEVHPHCGGANSCKGFSYDLATHVLTEHSCKGLNTCTGYSCILLEIISLGVRPRGEANNHHSYRFEAGQTGHSHPKFRPYFLLVGPHFPL